MRDGGGGCDESASVGATALNRQRYATLSATPSPRAIAIRRFLIAALIGLACVEAINSARVWFAASPPRVFPGDYVSQGMWSAGAFVRPPKRHSTDVAPALTAARRVWDGVPDLYREFRRAGPSFIYPPTAAVELMPLGLLVRGDDLARATQAMDLLARGCALLTLVVALGYAWPLAGDWRVRVGLAVAFLAFYPTRWMLACVQAQALITACLALAIVAYGRGRGVLSGVLVGLACGLKPHLGLLLLFGGVRREWGFCAGVLGAVAVIGGVGLVLLGIEPWRVYLAEVLPALSPGYGYYPNQTVNGLLNRWLGNATGFEIARASTVVSIGSLLATAVFAVLAVVTRGVSKRGAGEEQAWRRAMDLAIAVLCVTLASPVAWEHHYAWCVVLFALGLAGAGRATWLAIAYVALGSYFLPIRAADSGALTLLDSAPFLGALLLLWAAWQALVRCAPGRPAAASPAVD